MSEDLPYIDRVLRVAHAHIAHRAQPPTRFEPWTSNVKGSEMYRKYIGYACINTETDEVNYCYLVPDFEVILPMIHIHYGPSGDPDLDPAVASVRAEFYG